MNPSEIVQAGRRNLRALYGFTAASRLWFDGSLWLLYWQHKGISLFDIGVLEAILHVVCLVVDVPIGIFADRFGWKRSLLLSGLFGVVYCTLSLFGTNFLWAALAFAARGVQITFTNGSDAALAYESAGWAGLTERYQTISGRMMAITLVSLAVAEAVGGGLASWSWNAVYVAFAGANILSMFVVLWMKEPRNTATLGAVLPGQAVADAAQAVEPVHESALTIARDAVVFAKASPLFLRWLLFSSVLSGFIATFSFYGQSLLLHNGWSLLGIGILSGVENGVGAVVALSSEQVTGWLGERRTTVFAGTVSAVGLILFAFVPGLGSGVGYLTGSAGGNLADPLIDKELNRMVPTKQRATLLSANSTSFSLFMILIFPLFGLLATTIGLNRAAELASVLGLVVLVLTALTVRPAKSGSTEGVV